MIEPFNLWKKQAHPRRQLYPKRKQSLIFIHIDRSYGLEIRNYADVCMLLLRQYNKALSSSHPILEKAETNTWMTPGNTQFP